MSFAIGVDIGGTKTAIAIVNAIGDIVENNTIATDTTVSPELMCEQILHEIEKLIVRTGLSRNSMIGIGIGAPGPLDNKNGIIVCPPNLSLWVNFPIVDRFREKWEIPIALENDANVACLAESWLGEGTGYENFIYMTISTGIGTGVFADGKLLHGMKGNAGDIGHIVVDPSFGKCTCGQSGCLESIASGTAIANRGSAILGENVSTEEVFNYYTAGHPEIVLFIDKVFYLLGVGCVSLINTFDTEKIVIGGGVSKVGEPLFQAIRDYVSQFALNPAGRKTTIASAKLGQHAGVIGAAAIFLK